MDNKMCYRSKAGFESIHMVNNIIIINIFKSILKIKIIFRSCISYLIAAEVSQSGIFWHQMHFMDDTI